MSSPTAAERSLLAPAGLAAACLLLGIFSTYQHAAELGLTYLDTGTQFARHQAILDGVAGNPWQYRVLAAYLADIVMRGLGALGIPHHVAAAFILVRLAQDSVNAALAYVYYRRLGISAGLALLGISVLAWGTSYATYDSDLQFSTHFDITFYLIAAIALVSGRYLCVVAVTALAAFNRETSGLIPFMVLALALRTTRGPDRTGLLAAGLSAASFGAVFVGLRLVFGNQPLLIPYEHSPGWDLLRFNLGRPVTWIRVFSTLGIVPALALIGYRRWPRPLVTMCWTLVPAWFLIHWVGAVAAESRLFLVPQAVVLIPGALFFAQERAGRETPAPARLN